jgi:hypothetical protein
LRIAPTHGSRADYFFAGIITVAAVCATSHRAIGPQPMPGWSLDNTLGSHAQLVIALMRS